MRDDAPRVLSNRGANGIDGTLSSAFGVAAVTGGPVVALIGDVAFAHDIGGLLAASRLGLSLTIVVINNGGAAVFDFLPIAGEHDVYEAAHRDAARPRLRARGRALRVRHERPATLAELRESIAAPAGRTLIEVRTDRAEGLALHARRGRVRGAWRV